MIPYKLAYDAYRGISFDPEKRAISTREGFVTHIETTYIRLLMLDENRKEEIETDIDEYAEGYAKKEIALLRAKSNCVSTMIAGPSNFNVYRAEKKNDVAHKRLQETIRWSDYQIQKLNNKYKKVKKVEKEDVEKLISEYREYGINSLLKEGLYRKLMNIAKNNRIEEVKKSLENAKDIFTSRHKIHRELEVLIKKQTDESVKEKIKGVTIIDNIQEDRIQLFFDGKPDKDVITYLKSKAWKWTPSKGCWQNWRNSNRVKEIKEYLANEKERR